LAKAGPASNSGTGVEMRNNAWRPDVIVPGPALAPYVAMNVFRQEKRITGQVSPMGSGPLSRLFSGGVLKAGTRESMAAGSNNGNQRFVVTFSFILISIISVSAATYYVAPDGNNSNPGTKQQPFLTVQKAVDTAQAGDRVSVGPGTYNETVCSKRAGAAGGPIVLDGQGGATVKQVTLKHTYIHLQNFTVTGWTNRNSQLVYFDRGASCCVVSNNVVDVNYARGVQGIRWAAPRTLPLGTGVGDVGCDNWVVSNTVWRVCGTTMIAVFGDRNVVQGNRLLDGEAVDFFRLFGRSNYIVGNVCSNNFASEDIGNHPDFIQTFGDNGHGSMEHVIEGNYVTKIEGGQLTQLTADLVPEIRDWTFRNNVFEDIALQASCVVEGIKYYNNTFIRCNYKNGGHPLIFSSVYHKKKDGWGYAHGAEVVNNVFLDCGNERNNVGWYSFEKTLTNVVADYNFVSKNGYAPVVSGTYPVGTYIDGVAMWDTRKFYEVHGINGGDPLFVSVASGDYRLTSGSPLIGKGMNLNRLFTLDHRGILRGEHWDIGVFQFQAGAPDRPGAEVPRPCAPGGLRLVLYP
jgi:hypothetical protein